MPKNLRKLLDYINYERLIDGSFKKNYSLEEKNERQFRADPSDGLRPLKKFRKKL